MVEDIFIVLVSGLAVIALLIHMERRYIESGTGRPAGVRLTPGDKALIGCCVAGMVGLVLLLMLLPAPARAAVVADCPLGKFTDEPVDVRGYHTVILREGGRRAMYRHLPEQRAYQIFAGNGPQMQPDYLCLGPLGTVNNEGDNNE